MGDSPVCCLTGETFSGYQGERSTLPDRSAARSTLSDTAQHQRKRVVAHDLKLLRLH